MSTKRPYIILGVSQSKYISIFTMSVDELMPYVKEYEALIWKMFEKTSQSVEEDVETVKKWMRTQSRVPKTLSTNPLFQLKNFLYKLCFSRCRNKKLSAYEQCKQKIYSYYSIRNFVPELFSHHPLSPEMLESYKVLSVFKLQLSVASSYHFSHFTTLPKRVGLDRVLVIKLRDHDPEKLNTEHLFNHIINVTEIRLLCDCSSIDIYIYNFSGTKIARLLKTLLTRLQKLQAIGDVRKRKYSF